MKNKNKNLLAFIKIIVLRVTRVVWNKLLKEFCMKFWHIAFGNFMKGIVYSHHAQVKIRSNKFMVYQRNRKVL